MSNPCSYSDLELARLRQAEDLKELRILRKEAERLYDGAYRSYQKLMADLDRCYARMAELSRAGFGHLPETSSLEGRPEPQRAPGSNYHQGKGVTKTEKKQTTAEATDRRD